MPVSWGGSDGWMEARSKECSSSRLCLLLRSNHKTPRPRLDLDIDTKHQAPTHARALCVCGRASLLFSPKGNGRLCSSAFDRSRFQAWLIKAVCAGSDALSVHQSIRI